MHEAVREIFEIFGEKIFFVGGFVRDKLLCRDSKDIDMELIGTHPNEAVDKLELAGFKVDAFGKSWGILKIVGTPIELSFPRRERKTSDGHKGFFVDIDPTMTLKESLSRRDFTINALAMDKNGKLYDYFGGEKDLFSLILRAVDCNIVMEDPLRVFRAAQFCSRFNLKIDIDTLKALSYIQDVPSLPNDRIREEIKKLLFGVMPSKGMRVLYSTGALFPEFYLMIGCQQGALHHPEGDVWTHTLHCMDITPLFLHTPLPENALFALLLSVMLHDIGKPEVRTVENGKISFLHHAGVSARIAVSFLQRLGFSNEIISTVPLLVKYHMAPWELIRGHAPMSAYRRLARRINGSMRLLYLLAKADGMGRPPLKVKSIDEFWQKAQQAEVDVQAPQPLILGRHLIEWGFTPGKEFGPVLKKLFALQCAGDFDTVEGGHEIFLRKGLTSTLKRDTLS